MPTHDSRHNPWTDEEVQALKDGFLAGKRIKIIANELNRSETAVNKFLTRSGIRRKKQGSTNTLLMSVKKRRHQSRLQASTETLHRVYQGEQQANMLDVIEYMRNMGHKVSKNERCTIPGITMNEEYSIDGKPVSKTKLLLCANRLRIEENKPIFFVHSVMW